MRREIRADLAFNLSGSLHLWFKLLAKELFKPVILIRSPEPSLHGVLLIGCPSYALERPSIGKDRIQC